MSARVITTIGLIAASIVGGWLRFDLRSGVMTVVVVLMSLAGAVWTWIVQARRAPALVLPARFEELVSRDHLTPAEELRFRDDVQAWHHGRQREVWRDIDRGGAGPLVRIRAALYYLWMSLGAVAVLPPSIVPRTLLPGLPRFVIVLAPLAAIALIVAVPLAIRDLRKIRRRLRTH